LAPDQDYDGGIGTAFDIAQSTHDTLIGGGSRSPNE